MPTTKTDIVQEFLKAFRLKGHRQPAARTLHCYGQSLRSYLRWCDGRDPGLEQHGKYIQHLLDTRSRAYAGIAHAAIKAYHKHLGLPVADIFIAPQEPQVVFLTGPELDRLTAACESPLEHAVIWLLYESAIRASELLGLKWDDVNWDGFVTVRRKGGKVTDVPIFEHSLSALRELRELRALSVAKHYVFILNYNQLYNLVARLGKKAGLVVHPSILRHTRASHLRQQGLPIDRIQELLGHTDPMTTVRFYAHLTPHTLREDIERLGLDKP